MSCRAGCLERFAFGAHNFAMPVTRAPVRTAQSGRLDYLIKRRREDIVLPGYYPGFVSRHFRFFGRSARERKRKFYRRHCR